VETNVARNGCTAERHFT